MQVVPFFIVISCLCARSCYPSTIIPFTIHAIQCNAIQFFLNGTHPLSQTLLHPIQCVVVNKRQLLHFQNIVL